MGYAVFIDIAAVGVVLLFVLRGAAKGFLTSFLNLVGIAVSLLVSIYLAAAVCSALLPVPPFSLLFGGGGKITQALTGIAGGMIGTERYTDPDVLRALLTGKLPAAIVDAITAAANAAGLPSDIGTHEIIGNALSGWIYWLTVAMLLFIVIRLLLGVLTKVLNSAVRSSRGLSGANRIAGAALGAAKGVLILAVLFGVLSFVIQMPFMAGFNAELQSTGIARPFANAVFKFVGEHINLGKRLGDIFPSSVAPN